MERKIPRLYETEEVPLEKKVIHQVYAIPSIGFYWLIAELDEKENIAFGFANLNDDINAEWGYIPIDEIVENGGELVQDWKPCEYPEARKLIEEQRLDRPAAARLDLYDHKCLWSLFAGRLSTP